MARPDLATDLVGEGSPRHDAYIDEMDPHAERLFHAISDTLKNNLERRLAKGLFDLKIIVVPDRFPPIGEFRANFQFLVPPWGIVTIQSAKSSQTDLQTAVEMALPRLSEIRKEHGSSARAYVVVLGASGIDKLPLPETPEGVVLCLGKKTNLQPIAERIAKDFLAHSIRVRGRTGPPASALLTDKNELTSGLSKVTFELDWLMADVDRRILEHEFTHLRDEIGHQHFTAAALRVGRSVEFIIYAACRSWGVPVREPILVGLASIQGSFDEFSHALLAFAALDVNDTERGPAKKRALKAAKLLQGAMFDVVSNVDESAAFDANKPKPPRNPQALVNDIGRTFAAIEEVRSAVRDVKTPLSSLLRLRNAAAHASTDGDTREVAREELREMVDLLNAVLKQLARCGTAILQTKQATETSRT